MSDLREIAVANARAEFGGKRSHTVSPYRVALETTQQALLAALARNTERRPSFGITEERGPGGVVIPLFRCEVPVCEEHPTSQAALDALLAYHAEFRLAYPLNGSHATE